MPQIAIIYRVAGHQNSIEITFLAKRWAHKTNNRQRYQYFSPLVHTIETSPVLIVVVEANISIGP